MPGPMARWAPASLRMKPGTTALTVTPDGPSSMASARTSASSPALAAAEAGNVVRSERNAWATKLDTATTRPCVAARKCGRAAWASRKNAPWIAAVDVDSAASVNSAKGVRSANPALLISTSQPPKRSTVAATSAPAMVGSARSPSATCAWPPASRTCWATVSAASRLRRVCNRIAVPGAAIRRQIAAPMPLAAPVTRIVRTVVIPPFVHRCRSRGSGVWFKPSVFAVAASALGLPRLCAPPPVRHAPIGQARQVRRAAVRARARRTGLWSAPFSRN